MSSTTQGYTGNASESSTANRVKQDAAQVTERVKQQGANLAEEVKGQAKNMASEKMHEATENVKATSREYLAKKKHQASEELGVFRDAINKAAEKLRQENHPEVASYVAAAAEQFDRVRNVLEQRGIGDLASDARRFTRQHSELVYGGMFFAGLSMMRFLKASGRHDRDVEAERRMACHRPSPYTVTSQWPAGKLRESRQRQSNASGESTNKAHGLSEHVESPLTMPTGARANVNFASCRCQRVIANSITFDTHRQRGPAVGLLSQSPEIHRCKVDSRNSRSRLR